MDTSEAVLASAQTPAAPLLLERATGVSAEEQDGIVTEEGDEGGIVGDARTETTKSPWTTTGQLLLAWAKAKATGDDMADSVTVDVNVPVKAPLAGAEFKAFLAAEEAARQKLQVELAKGQLRLGEDERTQTTAARLAASKS